MAAEEKIGVIILAAGASSRLGAPKQLLPYAGNTLLQYIINVAIDSNAQPVLVILGSEAETINNHIDAGSAQIIVNNEWEEGMASSIRCGINALVKLDAQTGGAVIMVCDQPYTDPDLINKLMSAHKDTGRPIVASSYDGIVGVPAFFHKSIFPALLQLKGDVGAKSVIQQHSTEIGVVAFSKGGIDIDTKRDYKELSKSKPR